MPLRNSPNNYGLISKLFHWLIALHMIGLIALGWWMVDLSFYSSWYHLAPMLHKSFGVGIFLLGVGFFIWHRISKRPNSEASHQKWEKAASQIAHFILLLCILVIPVSGYIFSTANGEGVSIFDLFTLPAIGKISETVRNLAIDFHIYASYGILAVIGAHAGGALKHHFIDKDRTLRRMTF